MILSVPESDLETYILFLDESIEHLEIMEKELLARGEGMDADAISGIFRSLHSMKGVASFLGLSDIQKLSHRLESVFDLIRQGKVSMGDSVLQLCLDNIDFLATMLAHLRDGLNRRSHGTGRTWEVEVEEVDYEAGLEALNRFISEADRPLDPGPTQPGLEIADMESSSPSDSQENLITAEMAAAFVKEGEETLDSVERIFLRLSETPGETGALAEGFRGIHSFKGNSGFFGYGDMERLSHRLENVLQPIRDAGIPAPIPVIEQTLVCLDALRAAMASLAAGRGSAVPDCDRLCSLLDALLTDPGPSSAAAPPRLGEILVEEGLASPESVALALELQNRPLGRILVDEGLAEKDAVERGLLRQGVVEGTRSAPLPAQAKGVKRDLRVDLAKLDLLLDLVGELIISTGMVFNHPLLRQSGAAELEHAAHHLKNVVNDLQNVALGVRMIPVEGPFRKMTRLVHDLSGKSGKKARLELRGEETEIDKNVADLISDPLVHMIRNAIDHGLESPDERRASGKDPTGTIVLEAAQEGGEILISVRDDGRGMSRDRILEKVREKGLIDGDGSGLPDEEVFAFIFMPGFSTAETVTSTSGRGVGMDVVKSNIERMGGRISILSQKGRGSTIVLRIPLTLSIIDGMMVRVGGSMFTLPLLAVRESFRPEEKDVTRLAGGQEILSLRGKVLPVVRLHEVYAVPAEAASLKDGILLCLETRGESYCLFVDELLGQRQTVVKALPRILGNVPGVSSCSILDNGGISLILDVAGLFEKHSKLEGIR